MPGDALAQAVGTVDALSRSSGDEKRTGWRPVRMSIRSQKTKSSDIVVGTKMDYNAGNLFINDSSSAQPLVDSVLNAGWWG